MNVRALLQILLRIFLLFPVDVAWSQVYLNSWSESDIGCPVIEVSFF
jgi:hypothetical protein